MTVCLAGSEQALHVKNVLEEPQEHGLSEGRWYAVDADEALLEGHSVHTLAGVFGCSLQDLHVLQRAFESNEWSCVKRYAAGWEGESAFDPTWA